MDERNIIISELKQMITYYIIYFNSMKTILIVIFIIHSYSSQSNAKQINRRRFKKEDADFGTPSAEGIYNVMDEIKSTLGIVAG